MSALAAWLTRGTPLAAHRALVAGATVPEAAAAAGVTPAELFGRWSTCVRGQRDLYDHDEANGSEHPIGVPPDEADQMTEAFRQNLDKQHERGCTP
ncbi:MAG: hypothetical protein ACRDQB_05215 [Thermocrispum sp.]